MLKSETDLLDPEAGADGHYIPHPRAEEALDTPPVSRQRLKLITFNAQVGIETTAYHHYVTRGWRHFLPCPTRQANLDRAASMLAEYDVVALQEVDAGSVRSGHVNQVEYLARAGGFPHWYVQINRRLPMARHSLGLLSRYRPHEIIEHRLPGLFPGRGAMVVRFGADPADALTLVIAHLSLGRGSRRRQLAYLRDIVGAHEHVIVMGDLNAQPERIVGRGPLRRTSLRSPTPSMPTYPSWRPRRHLDHILLTSGLTVHDAQVVNGVPSDHLPMTLDISLPHDVQLLA